MVKIVGGKRLVQKLNQLSGKEKVELVGKALFAAADEIKAYARNSITSGAVSGAGHVASKPGEPPKADTHQLDTSIESHQVAPLRAQVVAEAPHAVPLEKGAKHKKGVHAASFPTRDDGKTKFGPIRREVGAYNVEARPFMRPASVAKRKRVIELVTKAVNIAVKRK